MNAYDPVQRIYVRPPHTDAFEQRKAYGWHSEPAVVAAELQAAGLTILPPLEAPATAEGGDMFYLDDRTLLAGLSYRTNEAAIEQLRPRLAEQGVEIITFDLSHFHGPGECLHL